MVTQNAKQTLGILAAAIIALLSLKVFFFLLGPAVYSFDAQTRMDTGISEDIEEVLKAHCNCDEVQQFFLMQGYQYKKQESFGKRAEYKIFNSKEGINQNKEMERLHTILLEKVACYDDLDLITFEFVNDEKHHIFSVQNGTLN